MSQFTKKISSFFKKLMPKKDAYVREGIRPVEDWHMIVVVFFVLLCSLGVVAYYFYVEIDQGKLFVVTEKSTQESALIDTALLKKTVDEIKARSQALDTFDQNKVIPPDPSI